MSSTFLFSSVVFTVLAVVWAEFTNVFPVEQSSVRLHLMTDKPIEVQPAEFELSIRPMDMFASDDEVDKDAERNQHGVFVQEGTVKFGDYMGCYCGRAITHNKLKARAKDKGQHILRHARRLVMDEDLWLDPTDVKSGNVHPTTEFPFAFVNEPSLPRLPNAAFFGSCHDQDGNMGKAVVAISEIKAGEEITACYSEDNMFPRDYQTLCQYNEFPKTFVGQKIKYIAKALNEQPVASYPRRVWQEWDEETGGSRVLDPQDGPLKGWRGKGRLPGSIEVYSSTPAFPLSATLAKVNITHWGNMVACVGNRTHAVASKAPLLSAGYVQQPPAGKLPNVVALPGACRDPRSEHVGIALYSIRPIREKEHIWWCRVNEEMDTHAPDDSQGKASPEPHGVCADRGFSVFLTHHAIRVHRTLVEMHEAVNNPDKRHADHQEMEFPPGGQLKGKDKTRELLEDLVDDEEMPDRVIGEL